jgi:hypothetical protein
LRVVGSSAQAVSCAAVTVHSGTEVMRAFYCLAHSFGAEIPYHLPRENRRPHNHSVQ